MAQNGVLGVYRGCGTIFGGTPYNLGVGKRSRVDTLLTAAQLFYIMVWKPNRLSVKLRNDYGKGADEGIHD